MYKLGSAIIEDQMLNGPIGNFAFDLFKNTSYSSETYLIHSCSYMYGSSKTF